MVDTKKSQSTAAFWAYISYSGQTDRHGCVMVFHGQGHGQRRLIGQVRMSKFNPIVI